MDIDIGWIFESEARKELSFDEAANRVRAAVAEKHTSRHMVTDGSIAGEDLWVIEVFPGYVIAQRGIRYYKIAYSLGEGGAIVVSDQLVEAERVWREKEQVGA